MGPKTEITAEITEPATGPNADGGDTADGNDRGPSSRRAGSLLRLLRIGGTVLLITVSLLAFPSVLPWLIAVWLVGGMLRLARRNSPAPVLAGLFALLLIKNPEWSLAAIALTGALAGATAVYIRLRPARPLWPMGLLVLLWAWHCWSFHSAIRPGQPPGLYTIVDPVVCLGDSLTDYGYPEELQKLIYNPVLDYGRDGITSEDGLKLVDEILAHRPRVLVLELGGHDYNQGRSRLQTWQNLSTIVERCQARGVLVILVEVPRGFVRDPFRGIERQLSRRYDLTLVSDTLIRQFILFSPICPPGIWLPDEQHLSRDGLHPNENGNRLFARTIADVLARRMGRQILQ